MSFRLSPGGRRRLLERWKTLWAGLGVAPAAHGPLLEELLVRHAEPQRYYHNLAHLERLFALLEAPPAPIGAPALEAPHLALAVWFHDAIYDPTREDNELKSALLAQARLEGLGLAGPLIQRVVNLILATADHQTQDPDGALFLDADLSILGSDPQTYQAYTQAIRQEYAWLPKGLYQERRASLLKRLLARERIYQTRAFAPLEEPARENLRRELAQIVL